MMNILICDDETDIVRALTIYLNNPDYHLFTAKDGVEACQIVEKEDIQLVLMDIMMPRMDGIAALSKIRETSNVPVILLTAKSEDTDIVLGLNLGADDYITKPFNPVEVLARVNSQLRRYTRLGSREMAPEVMTIGGIELDDRCKQVTLDGVAVALTPKEFEILKFLMSHAGRVYAPAQIYEAVWKEPSYGMDKTVTVHIRHLREKLEYDPANPRYIKLVFGQGYIIEKGREKS